MEAILEFMNTKPLMCICALIMVMIVLALAGIAVQDRFGKKDDKPIRIIRDSRVCPYEGSVVSPSDKDAPWLSYCLCEGAWVECRTTKRCCCTGVNATPSKI